MFETKFLPSLSSLYNPTNPTSDYKPVIPRWLVTPVSVKTRHFPQKTDIKTRH
jgi:hypothetical protein